MKSCHLVCFSLSFIYTSGFLQKSCQRIAHERYNRVCLMRFLVGFDCGYVVHLSQPDNIHLFHIFSVLILHVLHMNAFSYPLIQGCLCPHYYRFVTMIPVRDHKFLSVLQYLSASIIVCQIFYLKTAVDIVWEAMVIFLKWSSVSWQVEYLLTNIWMKNLKNFRQTFYWERRRPKLVQELWFHRYWYFERNIFDQTLADLNSYSSPL